MTTRIPFADVVEGLVEDANTLASKFAAETNEQISDEAQPRTPLTAAMWDSDPEMVRFKQQELERARRLGEFQDPSALAAELRD